MTTQFSAVDTTSAVQPCPDEPARIHLIPRRPENILDAAHRVKLLLPARYPNPQRAIKDIEKNFYPDLNVERTVTAILTNDQWDPSRDPRPAPVPGVVIHFRFGVNTAGATLSAQQATTDAEGRASVRVRVPAPLRNDPVDLRANNAIQVFASRDPNGGDEVACLVMLVHRNEDFDHPLGHGETPDEFATTLKRVIEGKTWLVRQTARDLPSDGVRAAQQLLNQVSCRKFGTTHHFLAVNGLYNAAMVAETRQFIQDFGAPAGGNAAAAYRAAQFHVRVEDEVKAYIPLEYQIAHEPGLVVDWHLLVGVEEWTSGTTARVMQADGLLDIYRAVVWVFIQQMVTRGTAFSTLAIRWMRNPQDNGPNRAPSDLNWPADVSTGVAYAYGGGASRDEFTTSLNANNPPPATIRQWSQYTGGTRAGPGHKIGIHSSEFNPNHPLLRDYIGIDCSAFVQRSAVESVFTADHCSDLVDTRIAQQVLFIGDRGSSDSWPRRLTTGSWPGHFRLLDRAMRFQIVFRGDALNVRDHHIVMLTMDNRATILDRTHLDDGDDQILQACGSTSFGGQRAPASSIRMGHVRKTECTRRVIASPLAYWGQFHGDWTGTAETVACEYGRIYLWP